MKTITQLYKESLNNNDINMIQSALKDLSETQSITTTEIKGKLLTKCAGYIIEEWIKEKIQNLDSDSANKFKAAEETYYDFLYDNTKIEVKSFQKGKKYSNTKLTASQVKNINDILFILVEYTAENSIDIVNIEFVKGSELKINNDRLVKK